MSRLMKRVLSILSLLICLTAVAAVGVGVISYKQTTGTERQDAFGAGTGQGTGGKASGKTAGESSDSNTTAGRADAPDSTGYSDGMEEADQNDSGKKIDNAYKPNDTGKKGNSDAAGDAGQSDDSKSENVEKAIQEFVGNMPLEDKIAQMFVLAPEVLTNTGPVTKAGKMTQDAMEQYPVGGFAYFSQNIQSKEQYAFMVENAQRYSKDRCGLSLFICVDEGAGSAAGIAEQGIPDGLEASDMSQVGVSDCAGAAVQAVEAGADILLLPADFRSAYDALLDAVKQGEIKESRIDESLWRICSAKNVS